MNFIVKISKKLLNITLNIITLLLMLLIKKDDNIWLFGSWFGDNFADNSKYLFLYCSQNKEKLGLQDAIWITNNNDVYTELKQNNYKVFKKWSLWSIYYHIKSGYHFICQDVSDINAHFSVKAKRIQLWHGVGFKNISLIDKVPTYNTFKYKLLHFIRTISSPGLWYKFTFLSTSKFATENIFNLSFRLYENEVIEGNYPRNIYLTNTNEEDMYLNDKQIAVIEQIKNERAKGNKIFLYLPTYRGDAQLINKKINLPLNISTYEEFIEFNEFLVANKIYVLSKFHFAGDESRIEGNYNFDNLTIDFDIYPILKYIDVLITDYSSIYADFLFLDRPIIFYAYDLNNYKNLDKGFLFDYEDVTPGEVAFNLKDLKYKMINVLQDDFYGRERIRIKNMYFGENSEDTFEDLIKRIKSVK